MIFSSKKVREYILGGARYVATIRRAGLYREGQRVELKLGDKRLKGKVIKVVPLERARGYLHISGFGSLEEWLSEARRLHKVDKLDGFEVVVVRVECS